jgi:hypothetical protein
MPEVGRPQIRFQISSGEPEALYVADFSNWLTLTNRPAVISITLPGSSNAITYAFNKRRINEFNSNTLYQNCGDCDFTPLPDGIYKVTVTSTSPYELTKYYLKTDEIRLDLDKLYIELGIDYNAAKKDEIEQLQKIEFFLKSAEANTRRGDLARAQRDFQYVQDLMTKNCKSCR